MSVCECVCVRECVCVCVALLFPLNLKFYDSKVFGREKLKE